VDLGRGGIPESVGYDLAKTRRRGAPSTEVRAPQWRANVRHPHDASKRWLRVSEQYRLTAQVTLQHHYLAIEAP
jgi:hypothetical protein